MGIGAVQALVGRDELAARGALVPATLALATLAGAALLVARGRSRSAKWLLTILCAIGCR